MNIIVNASGAKFGGARTIVESYCQWIENNDHEKHYIFIVGFDLKSSSRNISIINLKTSNLSSLLFSTFGVSIFCILYKSRTIISFMNLNTLLPLIKRVTYFHQAKFFSEKSIKFKIYGLLLKMQKNSVFVCQNSSIKQQLINYLNNSEKSEFIDLWPGVYIPEKVIKPEWYDTTISNPNKIIALCPYNDIRMTHKNFQLIYKSYEFLKKNNIQVIVTSEPYTYKSNDVFNFVGSCSYSELHYLYSHADIVLFPSLIETVGLPIFEAQYYKTPVITVEADYISILKNKFPNLNIITTSDLFLNIDVLDLSKKDTNIEAVCFSGEWGKLNKLL